MNVFSTPLQQMFCLIYIHFTHCLTFDLSFEGIHSRECQYLSTCCASICLCSARITTNYISFVKIWMTEAFLHTHGMIGCYLLVLEELFILYLDMPNSTAAKSGFGFPASPLRFATKSLSWMLFHHPCFTHFSWQGKWSRKVHTQDCHKECRVT